MHSVRTRVPLVGLLALLLCGSALSLAGCGTTEDISPRVEAQKPVLMVLTTLPLIFPEKFVLDGKKSEALAALETRYKVAPIGIADAASLKQGRLLLLAHPLAQPAEALVDLDQWVRAGGRVLLLADPKLDWPSERPLGDKLRPPPSFADTGLLKHWGLSLGGAQSDGSLSFEAGPYLLVTSSPGALESTGACKVSHARLMAHCKIGTGKVTVVADADFLNVGGSSAADEGNLGTLLVQLAKLEQ